MSALENKLFETIHKDRIKTLNEMKQRARYKIQVWFKSDRSMKNPIACSISAWQSGKRLHGGGDEMMFLCRRHATAPALARKDIKFTEGLTHKPGKLGCNMFIPGDMCINDVVHCPKCGSTHPAEYVGDSVFYRLTADKLALVLCDWWHRLENHADIYAKYSPVDPRTVMMARSFDPRTAREKKGLTIYPLKNILNDIANGSTLESRFKAFILA
jgi:hypothetical protein